MYSAIYMVIVISFVSSVVSYFIGWSKGYHAKVEKISKRDNGRPNANRVKKDLTEIKFIDEHGREIRSGTKIPKKARKSRWNHNDGNGKQKSFHRRPVKW